MAAIATVGRRRKVHEYSTSVIELFQPNLNNVLFHLSFLILKEGSI